MTSNTVAVIVKLMMIFKREMKKNGYSFNISKSKNVTETYQYRWFKSFWDRCLDDSISFDDAEQMIISLIKYAKRNNILRRGTALLFRNDIIDICVSELSKKLDQKSQILRILKNNFEKYGDIQNLSKYMLFKNHRDGYTRMYMLRESQQLDDYYIALSKKCMSIYMILPEKNILPNLLHYIKLRYKALDMIGIDELKNILKGDLNVKI